MLAAKAAEGSAAAIVALARELRHRTVERTDLDDMLDQLMNDDGDRSRHGERAWPTAEG